MAQGCRVQGATTPLNIHWILEESTWLFKLITCNSLLTSSTLENTPCPKPSGFGIQTLSKVKSHNKHPVVCAQQCDSKSRTRVITQQIKNRSVSYSNRPKTHKELLSTSGEVCTSFKPNELVGTDSI